MNSNNFFIISLVLLLCICTDIFIYVKNNNIKYKYIRNKINNNSNLSITKKNYHKIKNILFIIVNENKDYELYNWNIEKEYLSYEGNYKDHYVSILKNRSDSIFYYVIGSNGIQENNVFFDLNNYDINRNKQRDFTISIYSTFKYVLKNFMQFKEENINENIGSIIIDHNKIHFLIYSPTGFINSPGLINVYDNDLGALFFSIDIINNLLPHSKYNNTDINTLEKLKEYVNSNIIDIYNSMPLIDKLDWPNNIILYIDDDIIDYNLLAYIFRNDDIIINIDLNILENVITNHYSSDDKKINDNSAKELMMLWYQIKKIINIPNNVNIYLINKKTISSNIIKVLDYAINFKNKFQN